LSWRPTDDLQGRYLLPIGVALPLLSGAVLADRAPRRLHALLRAAVVVIPVAAIAVELLAWYINERRYAVGAGGPIAFFLHAQWSPAGGWVMWLGLWLVAGCGLLGATLIAQRWPVRWRAESAAA
jgi:hypothetical protein